MWLLPTDLLACPCIWICMVMHCTWYTWWQQLHCEMHLGILPWILPFLFHGYAPLFWWFPFEGIKWICSHWSLNCMPSLCFAFSITTASFILIASVWSSQLLFSSIVPLLRKSTCHSRLCVFMLEDCLTGPLWLSLAHRVSSSHKVYQSHWQAFY